LCSYSWLLFLRILPLLRCWDNMTHCRNSCSTLHAFHPMQVKCRRHVMKNLVLQLLPSNPIWMLILWLWCSRPSHLQDSHVHWICFLTKVSLKFEPHHFINVVSFSCYSQVLHHTMCLDPSAEFFWHLRPAKLIFRRISGRPNISQRVYNRGNDEPQSSPVNTIYMVFE